MKYDDASWHYEGDYPKELSINNAFTHIGMFLGWALTHNLAGEIHDDPDHIAALRNHTISGAQFLEQYCDGKFTDEDLNETGNAFAADYYPHSYFDDYMNTLDRNDEFKTHYLIPNTWANFEKVSAMLDQKFKVWNQNNYLSP